MVINTMGHFKFLQPVDWNWKCQLHVFPKYIGTYGIQLFWVKIVRDLRKNLKSYDSLFFLMLNPYFECAYTKCDYSKNLIALHLLTQLKRNNDHLTMVLLCFYPPVTTGSHLDTNEKHHLSLSLYIYIYIYTYICPVEIDKTWFM